MLPKVIFRRSWLYDEALVRPAKFRRRPPDRAIEQAITVLARQWQKYGSRILRLIAATTRLTWHEKEIVCYVTWGVRAYSDPLTLNMKGDIDTLTHELIHRILSEPVNLRRIIRNWNRVMSQYKSEPVVTRRHIVVHAIHMVILKKLFGEQRLQKEMDKVRSRLYIRAWRIVQQVGHSNIVKGLTRGLR